MDLYLHVRVLFGMVIGLAVAHLLGGLALIVQHPKRYKVYWVHLAWVLFLFLYVLHYWWWEFNLTLVRQWTFPLYLFIALYAVLIYLLCVLILPREISEYDGYRDYFYSRGQWFFAVLALTIFVDLGDTMLKGRDYYSRHAVSYDIRATLYFILSLIAIKFKRPWFHAFFAVFALIYEVGFILMLYRTLG
jgi:hypothetical protein